MKGKALAMLCWAVAAANGAVASWLHTAQMDGIGYFLTADPPAIQRFSFQTETWLDPVPLVETPTAFAAADGFIYVASGERIRRLTADGGSPVIFQELETPIHEMVVVGDFLYAAYGYGLVSIATSTAAIVDQANLNRRIRGISVSTRLGRLFARVVVSPSDIVAVTLLPDGMIGEMTDSPYHGDYPAAERTFVFPDEGRVADDSGTVYDTAGLTYLASFPGGFDDLVFSEGVPVALRGDELTTYAVDFSVHSVYTLGAPASTLMVSGDGLYAFAETAGTAIAWQSVRIADLDLPEWGDPDPRLVPFTPEQVILGPDTLYLLSRTYLRVFRWSLAEGDYVDPIPLQLAPTFMALDDAGSRLYLGYQGTGEVTRLDLDLDLAERYIVTAKDRLLGLAAPGEHVFTCDEVGAWESHIVYSSAGEEISAVDWHHYSREFTWSPAVRKIYHFRDWTSPNDLYWERLDEDGVLGEQRESPYHTSEGIQLPIRVSPDGARVVLGSGFVYDGETLEKIGELGTEIVDAMWMDGTLYTVRESGRFAEIQTWNDDFTAVHSVLVRGRALRLFGLDGQLLVVTLDDGGMTRMVVRDPDASPDLDGDGILDHLDNCPGTANADQADRDRDGVGDACNDAIDRDGDDWADAVDTCPEVVDPGQEDTDGDGLGDACNDHLDLDGDEWSDTLDNCPGTANGPQEDADEDGAGDACDICPQAPNDRALWIAAAARTDGLQGSVWRTDLSVRNQGYASVELFLLFLGQGGDNSAARCVPAGTLRGGRAVLLEDVLRTPLSVEGAGAVAVFAEGPVVATSRTYNQGELGTYGQGIAARSGAEALVRRQTATLLQLRETAAYRTNLGFLNLSPTLTSVSVRYLGEDGVVLGDGAYDLEAYEQLQVNRALAGAGVDVDNGVAQVTVMSGGPILAYASVVDNRTNDPTYQEPR